MDKIFVVTNHIGQERWHCFSLIVQLLKLHAFIKLRATMKTLILDQKTASPEFIYCMSKKSQM